MGFAWALQVLVGPVGGRSHLLYHLLTPDFDQINHFYFIGLVIAFVWWYSGLTPDSIRESFLTETPETL